MLIDNRGQLSVEIILLVGLSLIIVLGLVSYLREDLELNEVMAAAKMGSTNASNSLAYSTGNVIRFNNMTFNNGTITINIYSRRNLNVNNRSYIQNRSLQYIGRTLNRSVVNGTVQGIYRYNVTVVNIT